MSLTTYLRESMTRERQRANVRLTELALANESRNRAYFAECEKNTLARISRALPHYCASTLDGTVITCAPTSGNVPAVRPYTRLVKLG